MNVTVLGAGSWGTAIALLLSRNGHKITLAGRDSDAIASMMTVKENLKYLPGFALPDEIKISSFKNLNSEDEVCIVAVPSHTIKSIVEYIPEKANNIILATKGLGDADEFFLSDYFSKKLPNKNIGIISGPNLAMEVARGIPSASVAASKNNECAQLIAKLFHCHSFRVYISEDMTGVELAGALKNPLAIAGGMSDGLGFGDNTKGTLLARGLHEITRLGLAFNAEIETFMGVAGVGDLYATGNSKLSRNYRLGYGLGQGRTLEEMLEEIGQVVEGISTCKTAMTMSRHAKVELPINGVIEEVLYKELNPKDAVAKLMGREQKTEGFKGVKPCQNKLPI